MKTIADILALKPFVATLEATDLVSRQRLRLFRISTLLSLFVCIGFLIQVLIILPDNLLMPGLMFVLFLGLFFNFFAILWHKSPSTSYIILIATWLILIHINTYFSGGIKNSGNFYLATVILTAFILLGSKGGKVVSLLSLLHLFYFYFITTHTSWVSYVLVGSSETLLNVYFLLSTAVSLFLLSAQSNYIEKSKNAVVQSLHLKNGQLTEASDRLKLSTIAAKIGLWDWDIVNDITTWDSDMYSLHGVGDNFKVDYNNWQVLLHPEDRFKMQEQLKLTIKERTEYEAEYRIILPDESTRHIKVAARVSRDHNGRAVRILGANWDITESKKAEQAIITSNKRYELATKATSNVIWEWNLLTGEQFWSEAYRLSFGYTTMGATKRFDTFEAKIHPEDYERVNEGLVSIISGKNGDYWEDEYRFLKADGTYAYVYDRGYLVFDEQNKPVRFVGAMQDITRRKGVEMEREMIIKELIKSNADLKQFSFITSHNLRAPLSNISAILGLINQDSLDSYNTEMIEMLTVSAKQLVSTIDDLTKILVIKNNRNAQITRIDLRDTLHQIEKSFEASLSEVNGSIYTNITACELWFHKIYLESIFVNLISNAIKYRSPHRELVINVACHTDDNGNCILTFSDNGLGIDLKRYKDRIFGLYQRLHKTSEGQGLGLFIIKSQIESLGDEISVESEVDKGTTFTITFRKQLHKKQELLVESSYMQEQS